MTPKALLFDLGETLLSYGPININELFAHGAKLTYDYLSQQGIPDLTLPPLSSYVKKHTWTIKLHCVWAYLRQKEFNCLKLLDINIKKLGITLSQAQLEQLAWLWYEPLGTRATVEPDLHQTLTTLRQNGYQMAIISNVFLPASVLDRQLARFNLLEFFPIRIYSSDTLYRKPHRRIYQIALEKLEISGDQAIMVGDKIPEDIRGPSKLGIRGIFKRGVTNPHRKVPSGTPIIETIAELPRLLETLK